jgi:O-antigen/teichoic acid export membrane protein
MSSPGAQPRTGVLADEHVGRRVVHGGAQRAAGFAAANLLTVVGAIVLLRYLGVSEFGRYGTVMALLAVVQGISDAGLTVTGTRELAVVDDESRRREILAHVLGLRIVLSAVGVAFAVAFAVAAGYDSELVRGTLVAGIGVLLFSVQSAMLLPLGVELRNGRIALNEVLRQAALVAGWGIAVLVGAGLAWFFAVQAFVGVFLIAIAPLLLRRGHLAAPRWSREEMRELISVGLPIAISSVIGIVYFRILVVLASVLTDDEREIGLLVASARVVEVVVGLAFLLVTVILPVMTVAARDDARRLAYVTRRMTEVMAIVGLLAVLFLFFAAEPVMVALGGSQYEGAASVLQIQCLALFTIFVSAAWTPVLVSMGRQRLLVATTSFGLVALIVAGVALIPPYEAEGAAVAAVVADALLCFVTFLALRATGAASAISALALARILLAAIPGVLVGALLPVGDLVAGVLAAATFAGFALVLGAMPSEMIDAARGLRDREPPATSTAASDPPAPSGG